MRMGELVMEKIKENIIAYFIIGVPLLVFSWLIFMMYLDVKVKWNLAHIKNCPCIEQVKGE